MVPLTLQLGSGVREGEGVVDFWSLLTQTKARRRRTNPVLKKGIPMIMARSAEEGHLFWTSLSVLTMLSSSPADKIKGFMIACDKHLKAYHGILGFMLKSIYRGATKATE